MWQTWRNVREIFPAAFVHGIALGEDKDSAALLHLSALKRNAVQISGAQVEDARLAQHCSMQLQPCASSQQGLGTGDSGRDSTEGKLAPSSPSSEAVPSAITFDFVFSVNVKVSAFISHCTGRFRVLLETLASSFFRRSFPKVKVKFGKKCRTNMYKQSWSRFSRLRNYCERRVKGLMPCFQCLILLFFFCNRKSDPVQPANLCDHSKSGKARRTLEFLSSAKLADIWPNPTALF